VLAIIGTLVVLGSVLGGFMAEGGSLLLLWHPMEIVIICGAALGAFLISNPMKVVKAAFGGALGVAKGARYGRAEYIQLLKMVYDILVMARKEGVLAIERHIEDPSKSDIFKKYPKILADHHMMEFITDFTIETTRPFLQAGLKPDYVFINEDLSMKNGPLLSPQTYVEFIQPELRRLVAYFKSHGVPWVVVDTDGNCDLIIPYFMDVGVDAIWPLERASDMDPVAVRRKYGRALRLWGGVDKRELAKDHAAIDAHLNTLRPLVEEGGFIPTVDHLVPPDVPLGNFEHYMRRKHQLLRGEAF